MGENPFEGKVKLYIGESEIEPTIQKGISLEYEIPSKEPLAAFDPAQEGGDKTGVNVWHNGCIELTLTIDNEDNPIGKWYWNMMRRFKRERKALFWAVTHGYILRITCHDENENEGYFDITLPSQLRQIIRVTKFIPRYNICDRYGRLYIIRKGKVKRIPTWPLSAKYLKRYTNKLKRYKIQ